MSALEELRAKLDSLEDVRDPDIPVDIYFQEVEDVLAHVAANDLQQQMIDEGLDEGVFSELPQALSAAREAQVLWTLANDREKPTEQRDRESIGYKLRTRAAKKARFVLRRDMAALAALENILDGEGLADLVQDLDALASLIATNRDAFARNKNFDAAQTEKDLTTAASGIRGGLSGFRMSTAQSEAVELRNRAWTYLDNLVDDLREAGRASTDGRVALGFGSAYSRRMAANARRRKKATTES